MSVLRWSLSASLILAGVCMAAQTLPAPDPVSGNYRFAFGANGEQHEYVFTPATKVAPQIVAVVAVDAQTGEYSYTYSFGNGSSAQQDLYSISVESAFPVSLVSTVPGWQ